MFPEPFYSRLGDDLYRMHRTAGRLVAEEWVACAWHDVSDVDFVVCKARPITARTAANMIERRCGRAFARPI